MTKEKDKYKYDKLVCKNCGINRPLNIPKGYKIYDYIMKLDAKDGDICPNCGLKLEEVLK